MKEVMTWAGVSAAIIVVSLFIHSAPESSQGPLIAGALFIVSLCFAGRICMKG